MKGTLLAGLIVEFVKRGFEQKREDKEKAAKAKHKKQPRQ